MTHSVKSGKKRSKIDVIRAQQAAAAKKREQMLVLGVAVGAVIVFAIVLVLAFSTNNQGFELKTGTYSKLEQSATDTGAPILGSASAKITLIEFADFSCPHCREYKPTLAQVVDQYVVTGKARLIFQPMTYVSQNAGYNWSALAALVSLCANRQKAFWEMNDELYKLQGTNGPSAFTETQFKAIADRLKLDTGTLMECYRKQEYAAALQAADKRFAELKLEGVPGLLYSMDGGKTFQYFKDAQGNSVSIPPIELIKSVLDPLLG